MSKKSDEILNRFLDDDLSEKELHDLEDKIVKDEKFFAEFNAIKSVDNNLKDLDTYSAPAGFTEKFMLDLRYTPESKSSNIYNSAIFVFVVGIISSLAIIQVFGSGFESLQLFPDLSQYTDKLKISIPAINFTMSAKVIKYVVLGLSLVVTFGGYYIFENHRIFRQRLNNR